MDVTAPLVVQIGMFVLPVAVAVSFVVAAWAAAAPGARRSVTVRASLGMVVLLGSGAALAVSGNLADASRRPPAFPLFVVICTVATVFAARSSFGAAIARLPLWALVATQGFRLPLELLMHRAASASVMPPEMTFGGLNYDVVTGAIALVLGAALYAGSAPRAVVFAWNVMGSALLAIIVVVAFAATPLVRAFGPEHVNRWVFYFPYVWLPTVLVQAALFGHLVIFRRLRAETTPERGGTSAPSAAATGASVQRGS